MNYPVVLGHEFGGVIAHAGKAVRGFAEGDRVVSETAAVLDLDSPFTRAGQYNLDPNRLGFGYGVNGAMTQICARAGALPAPRAGRLCRLKKPRSPSRAAWLTTPSA